MATTRNTTRHCAGALVLALSLTGMIRAAYADCTTVEADVTCSGTTTGGFIAGANVDNLNVHILSGPTNIVQQTDFLLGTSTVSMALMVNAGNNIVNDGIIRNTGGTRATNYGVNLNGSDNTFTNNGLIELSVTAGDITTTAGKNTVVLRGIYTSATTAPFENNTFINNGSVVVSHAGIGAALGTYPGEDIDGITFDNHGTFAVNRTSALDVSVSGGNVFAKITGSSIAAAALGVAAAMSSDDDAEMTVINRATGTIEATGAYTAAMYVRAVELEVVNYGMIRNNSGAIAISAHGGAAGEHGELEIENFGTIIGDILAVDANALRYWAANKADPLTGLTLNNQAGVRDSEIENHGTITGNIYLGSGTHEIENDGTITGNILVDQAGIGTAIGSREFTLENSGILTGNVTIKDTAGAVNSITLTNGGFTGNITATTGAGDNSLTLLGVGTLHNVSNFSTLAVGAADAVVGGGDDDDDDDAGPAAPSAVWLLADGTTQTLTAGTTVNPGATLIVDSNLISDVTIAEGSVLVAGEMSHGIITGSINNGGTIYLPAVLDQQNHATPTTLTVTGSVNMEAGSILRTVITGNGSASADAPSSNAGLLKVGATGEVEAGAKILPVQQTSGLVRNGDWYRIATNTNGGSVFSTLPAVQNTALITWTVQENADSDLVIGATVKSAGSIPGLSSAGASTLNALLSSDNEQLHTLVSALQGLTSESAVRKASEQLRPETNGARSTVALTVNDRVQAVIDQRISQTNLTYNGASGVSTGESGSGRAGWVQGFGFYGQQDQRDGVDGYTASTGGIALGADTAIGSGDAMRVGIALSYASSKIDDDGVNTGNTTKIDSYGATLYGSYSMPSWYVNGALGLGLHKYDSTRQVTVGAIHDTDTAQYDGTQYVARIEGGLPLMFGKNTLVPLAYVSYSHLEQEAYTESSNAGTGLAVEKSNTDSVRTGLGAKMLFDVSEPGTNMVVELRAIWLHEFGDASQDSTARFAAGGASFTTSGVDIGRDSANLGIGMRFSSANSRQQVLISYDAEIRDQYIGHTALLQARQEF